MKLSDMEGYFPEPSKSSTSFIANKMNKSLEDGSLNFGTERYGQVFATLVLKAVAINSDYTGISKNCLSSRVI